MMAGNNLAGVTAAKAARSAAPVAAEKGRAGEGNIKQRAVQMTLYLEQPSYDQLRELEIALGDASEDWRDDDVVARFRAVVEEASAA